MLVKRVVWFLCFMHLFLFVFLVLLVSIFKNSFVLFCLCVVVFVTRLSGLLVCILWSFFLFCFCCFVLNLSFWFFSFLSKKKTPQIPDTAKTNKKQKCRKRTKNQLAQLCSQIVFSNFLGGLKNFMVWLKTL